MDDYSEYPQESIAWWYDDDEEGYRQPESEQGFEWCDAEDRE